MERQHPSLTLAVAFRRELALGGGDRVVGQVPDQPARRIPRLVFGLADDQMQADAVAQRPPQRRHAPPDVGEGCETIDVQRVIYATGAGAASDGFVAGLIDAGLARTDQHGMGLDVTLSLRVIARDGARDGGLWALGPIMRGVFWECTAVPDIRGQARLIATEIARHLAVAG